MNKNIGPKLWGFFLIALGIALAGKIFGIWQLKLFDGWWTLFLIVPSVISIISGGFKTSNTVGLILGVVLLLEERNVFHFEQLSKVLLPVLLVVVGIVLLVKNGKRDNPSNSGTNSSD